VILSSVFGARDGDPRQIVAAGEKPLEASLVRPRLDRLSRQAIEIQSEI
jgi:hypothetical protein